MKDKSRHEILRLRRIAAGVLQSDVAKYIDVSAGTLSLYEKHGVPLPKTGYGFNDTTPPAVKLERMARNWPTVSVTG